MMNFKTKSFWHSRIKIKKMVCSLFFECQWLLDGLDCRERKKITKCEMRGLSVGRPNVIEENERIFFSFFRSFVLSFVRSLKKKMSEFLRKKKDSRVILIGIVIQKNWLISLKTKTFNLLKVNYLTKSLFNELKTFAFEWNAQY